MGSRTFLAGIAAAALALPFAVAAEGDESVATVGFDQLDVSVQDGSIVVTGVSVFGGETVVVGEDATGDGQPTGFGLDLERAEISQDPATGDLQFRLVLADMVAGATTNNWVWSWPIGGSSLNDPQLLAYSSDRSGVPGSFHFGLGTGGGIAEDFSVADVDGEFDGEALVWRVAPSQIGVDPGGRVLAGAGSLFVTFGSRNAAFSMVGGSTFDELVATERFGVGGGATITVLDSDGEEVDEVDARVRRGEFSATIGDLDPGAYSVVVTTVYGDAEATQVFTVVI